MNSFANLKQPTQIAADPSSEQTDHLRVPTRLWKAGMSDPFGHVHRSSGKRIRAELVELGFQLSGGRGEAPAGLTDFVELLHGGSLIIDDIEDDSDFRRGEPTLHRVVGTPLAINTGNWMYFSALEELQDLPLAADVINQIMGQALRTIRRCHQGQGLDLAAHVVEMQRNEVAPTARAISRLKTGGLTALAASLGAVAAGASPMMQKSLQAFGMQLGVGLQMQNDFQELKAGTRQGGRCDDLRNGRVTWAWAWASEQTTDGEFIELQNLLDSSNSASITSIASALLDSISGSCETVIRSQIRGALSSLQAMCCPNSSSHLNRLVSRIERYYV